MSPHDPVEPPGSTRGVPSALDLQGEQARKSAASEPSSPATTRGAATTATPGDLSPTSEAATEGPFTELRRAAETAAVDPEVIMPKLPDDSSTPAPKTAWEETYRNEFQKNLESNRTLRFAAFIVLGIIVVLYLVLLLWVLASVFLRDVAPGVITDAWNWHVLVLVGVALVIFAAIPLSLAMALVKMISDTQGDDSADSPIKAPHVEFAKACMDLVKR